MLSIVDFVRSVQGGQAQPATGPSYRDQPNLLTEKAYLTAANPILDCLAGADSLSERDLFSKVASSTPSLDFPAFQAVMNQFLEKGLAHIVDRQPPYGDPVFALTGLGRDMLSTHP